VEAFILVNTQEIDSMLIESNLITTCMDLFFAFEWSSMLHQSAANIIVNALEGGQSRYQLQCHIVQECRLLDRIIIVLERDENQSKQRHLNDPYEETIFRSGIVGHLLILSQVIDRILGGIELEDCVPIANGEILHDAENDTGAKEIIYHAEEMLGGAEEEKGAVVVHIKPTLEDVDVFALTTIESFEGDVSTDCNGFHWDADGAQAENMLDTNVSSFSNQLQTESNTMFHDLEIAPSKDEEHIHVTAELELVINDIPVANIDEQVSNKDDVLDAKIELKNHVTNNVSAGSVYPQILEYLFPPTQLPLLPPPSPPPPSAPQTIAQLIHKHPKWTSFFTQTLAFLIQIQNTPLGDTPPPINQSDEISYSGGELLSMSETDLDVAVTMMNNLTNDAENESSLSDFGSKIDYPPSSNSNFYGHDNDCYVYDDDDDDDDDDVPVMDLFAGNFDNKPLDHDMDVVEPVQSIVDRVEREANDVLGGDKEDNGGMAEPGGFPMLSSNWAQFEGDVFSTEDSSRSSQDDCSFDADFSRFGSSEPANTDSVTKTMNDLKLKNQNGEKEIEMFNDPFGVKEESETTDDPFGTKDKGRRTSIDDLL